MELIFFLLHVPYSFLCSLNALFIGITYAQYKVYSIKYIEYKEHK